MYSVTQEIQVRYAETDQMGIVYHANYLVWFELGRTQLIDSLGFSYASMEKDHISAPVIDLTASYKKPVRYGEKPTIKTWVEAYDGLRVTYGYLIENESHDTCVEGQTVHVCVRKDSFQPILLRKHLPELHEAYEKVKKR